jgi:hypothetical protein
MSHTKTLTVIYIMIDQYQLSKLSGDIGDLSQSTLVQVNGATLSFTEKYFVGLLMRTTMVLNEVSEILQSRRPEHLRTVFILLRPLLDDFIQVLAIYKSEDVEEEINDCTARWAGLMLRAEWMDKNIGGGASMI